MIPVKKSPGRRATDNAHGLIQERQDEESGGSETSEGLNPEKMKSGRVRHDVKGNGIWEWADRFQRRRATDAPPDVNHFGGDLEVAEYKPRSTTESISSDIFEATSRMKAYSFDKKPTWTQRVLGWFKRS